ncbi:MAG: hypothetical protein GAK45_00939 [Pseudomonas citronellolis]|nr:MAG: hypothetical protein GAK45_00939 [Pseudomonas citronellolis]
MTLRVTCLIGSLLFTLCPLAQADSMRCGSHLISEGQTVDDVINVCGAPAQREVQEPTKGHIGSGGQRIDAGHEIQNWTYPPQNGAYQTLKFIDGKLIKIESRFK